MELPPALRSAIDRALQGTAASELALTAASLSRRYRDERRDGKAYVAGRDDALAYLATRLPATYAAIRAAFTAIAESCPDFAPATLLDVGAGPGTVLWAATDCWNGLAGATQLEASPVFLTVGQQLAEGTSLPAHTWKLADLAKDNIDGEPRDLVTAAYVLNELDPQARPRVIEQLWNLTAGAFVVVEPGTPAGWQRILGVRDQLIGLGGHVVAPCPHMKPCPLASPDWCHFAQRVARSRLHRQVKGADMPWEDEKFSYVAVRRQPLTTKRARIIARPRNAGGHTTLKLCQPDGASATKILSRRNGEAFKRARRSDWGDTL
jgi:ribosomal protein RSM22 (predicted rRNA methylase)